MAVKFSHWTSSVFLPANFLSPLCLSQFISTPPPPPPTLHLTNFPLRATPFHSALSTILSLSIPSRQVNWELCWPPGPTFKWVNTLAPGPGTWRVLAGARRRGTPFPSRVKISAQIFLGVLTRQLAGFTISCRLLAKLVGTRASGLRPARRNYLQRQG